MLRVLDLFSGIGGWSLGLERTGGFRTVAFVELDPFCRKVLAKHWPEVPQFEDVCEVGPDLPEADVITAGWPCQDISIAGKGEGLSGERSGLWREVVRIAGLVGPRYVLLENTTALLDRGMGEVLGTLADIGYDAEWGCISAAAHGATHIRDRVWIVAYPGEQRLEGPVQSRNGATPSSPIVPWCALARGTGEAPEDFWTTESPFLGKDDDVPCWVDRIAACGNAVVPKVSEMIGRSILEAESENAA